MAFSRDGTQLASVSDDKTLRVWDLSWASSADTTPTCKLAATMSGSHSRTIYTVDWSPEGLLATGERSLSRELAVFLLASWCALGQA